MPKCKCKVGTKKIILTIKITIMQQTFNFTLNEKCYARIFKQKEKFYVEWLGLYLHKHIKKKCKNYDEALNIYNNLIE